MQRCVACLIKPKDEGEHYMDHYRKYPLPAMKELRAEEYMKHRVVWFARLVKKEREKEKVDIIVKQQETDEVEEEKRP
jgi:hypothetical protein